MAAPILSIDEGQLGKAIVAVLEVAAQDKNDTTAARWWASDLLDRLITWQRPGGWWSYYPDPQQAPHRSPSLIDQAHYDDDGIASLVLALLRGYEVLGEQRYLDAVYLALDHARLCQSRSRHGGIPGTASADGYALSQRAFEPAGCDSATATVSMGLAALAAIKVGNRPEDRALVKTAVAYLGKTKLTDGRWPRYTLAYAPEPVPVYGANERPYLLTDREDKRIATGYAWEGNWGKALIDAAGVQ